ncbi:MAG: glycerol kinase GlpK [Planctomycetota bacterium]
MRVLALDQGTTSSRAIVFDENARIVAVAQREFEQHFPRPGWVEHDANEIWATQAAVVDEALAKAGDIAAVGITNQRETSVVWDRATGEPIHRAIVWQDRRTAGRCDELRAAGHEDLVRARTGLTLDAYFSGTKVAWILDHVDGARARAEAGELAFGTIDSWLAYKLCGLHVTDASNASRTMLFDIHGQRWDEELCALLGVPMAMLPEVRDSSEVYGEVRETAAAGAPLAGILGDQQAAAAGQLAFTPGSAKNTYGTGCFLLLNTGPDAPLSDSGLLTTVAWRRGGETTYALEGSVFIGGAVVQWLRDGLGIIGKSSDVERLARTVEDTGDVFLVPAFAGLGAPHWDPYARGALVGLTRGTTAAHIAHAALQSIGFQVADLVDAMPAELTELRVDGGAAANDLLLQFQADLLRVPIERPAVLETTALGVAYFAGLATGVWKSTDEIALHREVDRTFLPAMDESEAKRLRARWSEAVTRARGWEERA